MSVVIGTNTASLKAAHYMSTNRSDLEQSMARLASGKRINTAADDAGGVGIGARLTAQARAMDMSARNALDGISAAEVADAALVEIQNMAIRVKELAVQKASGTYNSTDTAAIGAEITALNAEASRISGAAKFNDKTLSSGTFALAISGSDTTTSFSFPAIPTSVGSTASAAETAISTIATARGTLGATINRLEHAAASLSATATSSYASASRIQDADYARESANVAKGQVLMQAGAAVLAQANASTQYTLMLLQ